MTPSSPITAECLAGMVADLKEWPSIGYDNGRFELAVMPFLTFYFDYAPQRCLDTSLAMIDIHEAFERLLGHPYTVGTHPDSGIPHRYGSKRLGDLRTRARKLRPRNTFAFNFSDEKDTHSSPTISGRFWRQADWINASSSYSFIQFHYRWQWWLDNKDAWRRFVLETIERLRPDQVYSGFAMAHPLSGDPADVGAWERALIPHFHGLDSDHPPTMARARNLPSGLRAPTWGFFLSDSWRAKLGLERGQVLAALRSPEIAVVDCGNGQWIELGPQPGLHPVENGIPELPAQLARLLRPVLHRRLELPGLGTDSPHERLLARRWLSRFENAQDAEQGHLSDRDADSFCPRSGWWRSLLGTGARIHLRAGERFPSRVPGDLQHIQHWHWCEDQQGDVPVDSEPARAVLSGCPAPRAGCWQALDAPTVRCRTEAGATLPRHQDTPVLWCWLGEDRDDYAKPSGELCRRAGLWYCEDHPTGLRHFDAGQPLPRIEDREVYWLLHEWSDPHAFFADAGRTEKADALAGRAAARFLAMESALHALPDEAIDALADIGIDSASGPE